MASPFYYAAAPLSMLRRLFFIFCALGSLTAWADPPKFSSGGVTFAIQYGPGFFTFDRAFLGSQVPQVYADTYLADLQNTHTLAVRLGYNILGHASIEANLV